MASTSSPTPGPSSQTQPVTPLTTEYPELAHLSREDLEDLLRDPAYFQAVFYSLSRVQSLYESQGELGLANESIAQTNLNLQDSLYALREDTKAAFDEAKALEARWKEIDREQKELYQRFSPQFLLLRLRHAATAQDDASEAAASAFVQAARTEGGKDVDEFVREFKEMRKQYHKRAMWVERWTAGDVAWRDD